MDSIWPGPKNRCTSLAAPVISRVRESSQPRDWWCPFGKHACQPRDGRVHSEPLGEDGSWTAIGWLVWNGAPRKWRRCGNGWSGGGRGGGAGGGRPPGGGAAPRGRGGRPGGG